MSFGTLVVIVLAGLGGPLLGLSGRLFVPVMIGEILAGVIVGRTGLGAVDPANTTISFLGEVGFAMLMLTVGVHLPLRDPRLSASLRSGMVLAAIVGVLAVPAGLAAAAVAGTSHAAIYAVVLASGSAAVLLPAFEETDAGGPDVLAVMAQVTIADVVTILSVPIVLQPGRIVHAVLGGVLVTITVVLAAWSRAAAVRPRMGAPCPPALQAPPLGARPAPVAARSVPARLDRAEERHERSDRGVRRGLMVALIGGPKRLSTQMRGIAEGFFIPLYFVVLGAQLDLHGLIHDPAMIALAGALAALNVLIHLAAVAITRRPLSAGLAACAQLGVPAAVASLGLSEGVLSAAVATAIVAAALVSLGVCTVGVDLLVGHEHDGAAMPAPGPSAPARL